MPPDKAIVMETQYPRRKHPRLKNKTLYSNPGTVAHIIIRTHHKIPYFNDAELVRAFCTLLVETAKQNQNPIYAYCIMPDHIHLLTSPSKAMDLITLVKRIKGAFTGDCRRKGKEIRFQKSFYDHILRREEDVLEVAKYIIANPVRAGISRRLGERSRAGSLEFKL